MSLRTWPLSAVLGSCVAWILLISVVGLPRVLRLFSARGPSGGMVGVSFGPREMVLAGLLAIVPPLVLLVVWMIARRA